MSQIDDLFICMPKNIGHKEAINNIARLNRFMGGIPQQNSTRRDDIFESYKYLREELEARDMIQSIMD